MIHPVVSAVTDRVIERSKPSRRRYLDLIERERANHISRPTLGCANAAHAYAGTADDRDVMKSGKAMNIGIVSAYNDMLSAHAPYYRYPEQLKVWAREVGATAQVAGGVPAMCDGVTQGYAGMELSLFSRDTIALATAVALSHGTFEGALLLGICDKIVPGLLMGALRFGHLPMILIPGGPMPTGMANKDKAAVREAYAEGKVDRAALLDAEISAYHGKGTCTFYGTANTNQMMVEAMGLHMPGAAFIPPGTKLRQELSRAATHRIADLGWDGDDYRPLGLCVDEKAIVNAAAAILATGGSTNHFLHLPAIARSAGIVFDWQDFADLSEVVPLIARVYPNGAADVNAFEGAGGPGYILSELLGAGLAHGDILTVAGSSLSDHARRPALDGDALIWIDPGPSGDDGVLATVAKPFQADGGTRLLAGNLGRACMKVSAVDPERWTVEAPCRVFDSQQAVQVAFDAGELDRDVVVIVRFQGPRANGMPELHKLTPPLGVLQNRGHRVALITDGRMSGASGKVPAAIHVSPEAANGGPLGKLIDGDVVRVDAVTGELAVLIDPAEWVARPQAEPPPPAEGMGRELFGLFRHLADEAERGASAILAGAGL